MEAKFAATALVDGGGVLVVLAAADATGRRSLLDIPAGGVPEGKRL